GREAVAFGEQNVGEPAAQSDRHQRRELDPGRHQPAQGPGREARQRADQGEVEHDRGGGLGLRQAAGLDHRAGIAERPADRKREAERGARCARMRGEIEMWTSITRMPTKPAITANQRYMRTRSFRKSADIATVISGDTKEMAVASTIGSRARAAKLQNMPQMLIR